MNIDLSTKPQVTIDLNPLLEAYCRHIFNTPVEQKKIILTRKHPIGKCVNSHWLISDLPVARPFRNNPVTFILPVTDKNHYALRYRFYHVSKLGEEQITDWIEIDFKQWINRFFEKGYEMAYTQTQIIEAVLRALNVRNNAANFDAIKKIDYRKRRSIQEKRFEYLLNSI